ncbi:MAG: response regulator [Bacteroidetes bacterium]|nr:response regulator [Bacteroidota bacterium]
MYRKLPAFLQLVYSFFLKSLLFCLWGIVGEENIAQAQSKIDTYLSLKGQARLDSLLLQQHLVWYNLDSTSAFAQIDIIKKHGLQSNDQLLAIYADYLRAYYLLGGKQKNIEIAYSRFQNVVKKLEKLPSSTLKTAFLADVEHNMGVTLYLTRDVSSKCINHLLAADLAFRKIGYENFAFAGYRLTYLALYYLKRASDAETALKYLKEGETYIQNDPVDFHRIQLYRNIALCLVEKKQYQEAIRYNQLGIAQVRTRKDSLRIGALNGNIGEIILAHFPNPKEAEPYFKKELWYRLRFKPDGYEDLSKLYSNLCQVAGHKRNPAEVTHYYNQAIKVAELNTDKAAWYPAHSDIYRSRMIADTLLGDYKSALKHEFLFQDAQSKIKKDDLSKSAVEASVRFDSEKLKLQAELANQQTQNSRFWIAFVSLLLLVTLLVGYFIYYRLQTRREELARQLLFEQKEAERLAELDTLKTRFFTNISHEFRTPLTLLLSPLQDLQKEFPKRTIFQVMQRNAERLLSLISQLLDLSKLEAGKMEVQLQEGDLSQFLQYIFSSFESLGQDKNILFQYQQSREHQFAYFDADKIEKITTNLLSNAFKFTPENGRIQIRADYSDTSLLIEIKDYGIGIDKERLPKIFERFYQIDDSTQRNYEGTGVGLALVKELVEVLGGTISVASELGRGTTFNINLPTEFLDKKPESTTNTLHFNNTAKIPDNVVENKTTNEEEYPVLLIVEDNADLRAYIRSQFESTFFIIEAKDGKDGLEKALETIPDLAICDLMMPHLDGFEFCKQLKIDMRTSHIPVVMLTAKAAIEDRLVGLELGADDYLSKPFNTDELQIRVRNLIKIRENIRQKYNTPKLLTTEVEPAIQPQIHDQEFLEKINHVLEKNISNSAFEMENLAKSLSISSTQLRRKLKALTNQTIIEYVRNYRLDKAAQMLKNGEGGVSEIAYKVGFESLSYFSKVFQERFQQSPSEWK